MAGSGKNSGQSGVARAMSILKAFAGDQIELSLTEICERTQLASSTAHRWLQELVTQGALERLPSGRYCLSRLIWEIGTRCPRASILRDIAMPVLQDLYQSTRGHVVLAMPADDKALVVERLLKNISVQPVGRVGGRLPLHATCVGKAILAYAPAEVRKRILQSKLASYTSYTITSPQCLKDELNDIRKYGYAACHQERTIGLNSYAVPVLQHGSENILLAAVAVLIEVGPKEADGLLNALRPAAVQISRALRKAPIKYPFDGV
ncbi:MULTISPECIES: IclR family transcriptional regulator [unclassified Nonomuraea]|uniref:IclR family transcriptional regulator n=1 Tax=unclassified Nonomuraea TaxID=2593643 RepID=UPI0033FD0281